MKIIKWTVFSSMILLLWHCSVQNTSFNWPPNISESDRKEFVTRFNHGIKLYKINCDKCHNNSSKLPGQDFTKEQIRSYEIFLKLRNNTHEFTQKMNSEDVDDIIIYLKYRKL
jgi:hypothetical protein